MFIQSHRLITCNSICVLILLSLVFCHICTRCYVTYIVTMVDAHVKHSQDSNNEVKVCKKKSQVSDIFFLLLGLNDVIESVYEYYGHLGHRD